MGDQLSKRRAETWPGRVRRSLVAFRSPAAGRMPKPGPVVCEVRSGPARPSGGRETGKTDSTTVEITCGCRRMTDRARHFANFCKREKRLSPIRLREIRVFSGVCRASNYDSPRKRNGRARHMAIGKTTKSYPSTSVLRIEKNGKVRRAGRSSRACVAHGE